MKKFRICKNKYGWFKLQLWYPPKKIFFITLKGRWKDTCFPWGVDKYSKECLLFESFKGAETAMKNMLKAREKLNSEWVSVKE